MTEQGACAKAAVQEVASEITAAESGTPLEVVRELFQCESGYATPKVDVRGVVFRDDRLLLVLESANGG